jgi:O-antigen ligase
MRIARILIFTAVVLGLLAAGGGVFLRPVVIASLVLSLAALLSLSGWKARRWRPGRVAVAQLLLLGFLLLTLLPLPLLFSFTTGPQRYEQNKRVADVAEYAADVELVPATPLRFSTTRNRAGTLRVLFYLCLTIASGYFAFGAGRERVALLEIIAATGAAVAITGFLSQWIWPQGFQLWWCIPVPHALPGPVGGFVNPNHFAGFLALLTPIPVALAVARYRQRRWLLTLLNVLEALAMLGAIMVSFSRGGLLAVCGGLGVALLIASVQLPPRTRLALGAIVGTCVLLMLAGALSQPRVRARMATLRDPIHTSSGRDRLAAWRDSLPILRRYPLMGAGANAFRTVYPQHRQTSEMAYREFAENEYIQTLTDLGIIGTLLMGLLVVSALLPLASAPGTPPATLHGINLTAITAGVLTAAGIHALFEFVMHLPLYEVILATIIGLHWRQRVEQRGGNPQQVSPWPLMAALGITVALLPTVRSAQQLDKLGHISAADPPALLRALVSAPTSPHAWMRLAERTMALHPEQTELIQVCADQAVNYDPNSYDMWRRLGRLRQAQDDTPGARAAYRQVKRLRAWATVPQLPE